MFKKSNKQRTWRAVALTCAAGTLFGASCSSDGFQAVVAGVEAAAQELDRQDRHDDISFGNWLLDELGDL
ncbi:MAG: hypothetical protein IIB60_00990 [Planctomycetes bacterium]|nr:hypothetical protein [Planctomycetota bacterium]